MNELKHEDVMKALECWASGKPCQEECLILEHEEGASCLKLTARSALALLREKDAEIERLSAENEEQDQAIIRALHSMGEIRRTARAEAITEFEKKLMEKKCHYTETEHTFDFYGVTVEDIEQTAKELKGEPDEL